MEVHFTFSNAYQVFDGMPLCPHSTSEFRDSGNNMNIAISNTEIGTRYYCSSPQFPCQPPPQPPWTPPPLYPVHPPNHNQCSYQPHLQNQYPQPYFGNQFENPFQPVPNYVPQNSYQLNNLPFMPQYQPYVTNSQHHYQFVNQQDPGLHQTFPAHLQPFQHHHSYPIDQPISKEPLQTQVVYCQNHEQRKDFSEHNSSTMASSSASQSFLSSSSQKRKIDETFEKIKILLQEYYETLKVHDIEDINSVPKQLGEVPNGAKGEEAARKPAMDKLEFDCPSSFSTLSDRDWQERPKTYNDTHKLLDEISARSFPVSDSRTVYNELDVLPIQESEVEQALENKVISEYASNYVLSKPLKLRKSVHVGAVSHLKSFKQREKLVEGLMSIDEKTLLERSAFENAFGNSSRHELNVLYNMILVENIGRNNPWRRKVDPILEVVNAEIEGLSLSDNASIIVFSGMKLSKEKPYYVHNVLCIRDILNASWLKHSSSYTFWLLFEGLEKSTLSWSVKFTWEKQNSKPKVLKWRDKVRLRDCELIQVMHVATTCIRSLFWKWSPTTPTWRGSFYREMEFMVFTYEEIALIARAARGKDSPFSTRSVKLGFGEDNLPKVSFVVVEHLTSFLNSRDKFKTEAVSTSFHENLCKVEQVMMPFKLVCTLLVGLSRTAKKNFLVQRYNVVLVSPKSVLFGWDPNCETMPYHWWKREEVREIHLKQGYHYILTFYPMYNSFSCKSKLEVLEFALLNTQGHALLRLCFPTAEEFCPNNLMLHHYYWELLRDYFEAYMDIKKFLQKFSLPLANKFIEGLKVVLNKELQTLKEKRKRMFGRFKLHFFFRGSFSWVLCTLTNPLILYYETMLTTPSFKR